jgi:NADH pyrophosphatase NudC (nudix superfamily)
VLREVREEVSLAGTVTGLVGMYPFGRRNQLIIAYHVVVAGLDVVKQEDEIADYRWVPLAKLVPWNAATGLALHDWMRSRGYDRAPVRFGDHLPSS